MGLKRQFLPYKYKGQLFGRLIAIRQGPRTLDKDLVLLGNIPRNFIHWWLELNLVRTMISLLLAICMVYVLI